MEITTTISCKMASIKLTRGRQIRTLAGDLRYSVLIRVDAIDSKDNDAGACVNHARVDGFIDEVTTTDEAKMIHAMVTLLGGW